MKTRNLLIAMGVSGVLLSLLVAWGGVPSLSTYDLQLLFQKISCKIRPKEKEYSYRSCLCSSGKKSKLKKKVRFAPNVVEPRCNNEEYRRKGKSVVARTMSSSEEIRTSGKHMNATGTKLVEFQTLAKLPGSRASWYSSMLKYRNQIRDKRKYF